VESIATARRLAIAHGVFDGARFAGRQAMTNRNRALLMRTGLAVWVASCGGSSTPPAVEPQPAVRSATPAASAPAPAPGDPANVEVVGHVFKPTSLPAPEVGALHAPKGFQITKLAEHLGNARMLAVGKTGAVYVSRRETGDVLMLPLDGKGGVGEPVRVVSRSGLHGIAFHGSKVYLATPNEVFTAEVLPDGRFGPLDMIIHNLPDAGQHNTRTVAVGPDDMLYVSVASTCNECNETSPESATILRATLDGKSRAIFASGLRDVVGWGWHPETGELWAMDHGMDWLGDNKQVEELNLIEKGKRYGWPYVFGEDNEANPHVDPPGMLSKDEWRTTSVPAVLGYTAHASPMQMSFYTGAQFPADYRGDAFVSMRGSWNRRPASGYEVVRVHFDHGKPIRFEPFVTGFLTPAGETGRLCGNAVMVDGSLIFSDDRNGVLYRVAYTGTEAAPAPVTAAAIPAGPMKQQTSPGTMVPLAKDRTETRPAGDATLVVKSPAFANNAVIPPVYSEYEQKASIPLSWTAGPSGTKSYVVIMEDPDSKTPPTPPVPVVHWVVWNIPAQVTSLREGLAKGDRLQDPKDLRQGPGTSGIVGYYGPRPPAGDPPHHYHLQLFALDTDLALPGGADRDKVLTALAGHVLAKGELVGTFKRPDKPSRP
jgi:Raf kinase inhibitor-like YbhB/YbcL family protein